MEIKVEQFSTTERKLCKPGFEPGASLYVPIFSNLSNLTISGMGRLGGKVLARIAKILCSNHEVNTFRSVC